jgi:serine protease Do
MGVTPASSVMNLRALPTTVWLVLLISAGCARPEPPRPRPFPDFSLPPATIRSCGYIDGLAALDECVAAADRGDLAAMRKLFDAYSGGFAVPKNVRKAEEYLTKASDAGAEWARLIVASRLENSEPQRAIALYLDLARRDNCHAQARVARAYATGDLTERNATQGYFWELLAKAGGISRESDSHPLARLDDGRTLALGDRHSCALANSRLRSLEPGLSQELVALAQDAATKWRRGQQEASLPSPNAGIISPGRRADPLPQESPGSQEPRSGSSGLPGTAMPPASTAAPLPGWTPMAALGRSPAIAAPLDTVKLFTLASRSVWLVAAATSLDDLKEGKTLSLGSAVAVTPALLLTNCHIIDRRPVVWIKQGEAIARVRVASADVQTDRCVLAVDDVTLSPVPGTRSYEGLKVGEDVFTIGAPSGLEATFAQGVISGLRLLERRRLIQTTAPISPGSSGGGLFDKAGNLLGITTFRVRDGQSLNFAIAVDDYFQ